MYDLVETACPGLAKNPRIPARIYITGNTTFATPAATAVILGTSAGTVSNTYELVRAEPETIGVVARDYCAKQGAQAVPEGRRKASPHFSPGVCRQPVEQLVVATAGLDVLHRVLWARDHAHQLVQATFWFISALAAINIL